MESFYFSLSYQQVIHKANLLVIFALSKDVTSSKLNTSTNGINEIALIFQSINNGGPFSSKFKEKRKNQYKRRTMPCYDKFTNRSFISTNMGPLNPNPKMIHNNN